MARPQSIEQHNQAQVGYFSSRVKPTMVPRTTPYVRNHVDRLLRFAEVGPGDAVLEVGCGMGRYTLPLAAAGVQVHGLDLTPFLLDRLKEQARDRYDIPLYCADVIDHPPQLRDRFSAVIGFFTLHHIYDLEAAFQAMVRLLAPGGRIVFLEPNAFNPLYYIQILTTPGMTWQGDKGIVEMRRGVVFRAMRNAGLHDLALQRFGFFPPAIYNRPWGARLEGGLERASLWNVVLPFQLFKGTRSAGCS